jgi:hypothetical protein
MHHMVLPDAPFVQEMLVDGVVPGSDIPGEPEPMQLF